MIEGELWDDRTLTLLTQAIYDLIPKNGWPGRQGLSYLNDEQFEIVADKMKILMDLTPLSKLETYEAQKKEAQMETEAIYVNPKMSYRAVNNDGELSIEVFILHPDSAEILTTLRYTDIQRLNGTAHGVQQAVDTFVSILDNGFYEGIEEMGLEVGITAEDLTDRALTVDDILDAGEGLDDIVDS